MHAGTCVRITAGEGKSFLLPKPTVHNCQAAASTKSASRRAVQKFVPVHLATKWSILAQASCMIPPVASVNQDNPECTREHAASITS